jgi:hypothetical protein
MDSAQEDEKKHTVDENTQAALVAIISSLLEHFLEHM